MYKNTFAIIGGDLRQSHVANRLASKGFKVAVYLLDKKVELSSKVIKIKDVSELSDYNVIIFGLPMCTEGTKINAPFSNKELTVEECIPYIKTGTLLLGGRVTPVVEEILQNKDFEIIDYLEREELAVLNAVPTAEGAIDIAMQELPTTIFGRRMLITGFGRISKVLCKILVAMGAEVTVAARKYSDLAWISIYGGHPIHITALDEVVSSMDVIFNTIPAVILDDSILSLLGRDCLVIDLASKPGGVDFITAKHLGIKTIWALSLPGKVAPISAGDIIFSTIINIIDERGQIYGKD